MFKNRELLIGVFFILSSFTAFVAALFCMPDFMLLIVFGYGLILLIGFLAFYRYRYRKLHALSEFLRKSQHQLLPLSIADQKEGEFSILKTELYKLLTTQHMQAEQLKQNNTYLADTISDISHQLKTPLTSIQIMTDLLKEDDLPEEKRIFFTDTIRRQTNRMEWLLSSMLTISKLDAGSIQLKQETVKVSELFQRASEHLLIPMELHQQTFVMNIDKDTSYCGDLYWSSEAISNILKNCIEHTKDGGVITIRAEENSIFTHIEIQDSGGGISKEDLPHIFERFYKGKNASPDSVGIGLALAKQLIHKQNGTIEVFSDSQTFTIFRIKFYHFNV